MGGDGSGGHQLPRSGEARNSSSVVASTPTAACPVAMHSTLPMWNSSGTSLVCTCAPQSRAYVHHRRNGLTVRQEGDRSFEQLTFLTISPNNSVIVKQVVKASYSISTYCHMPWQTGSKTKQQKNLTSKTK